MKIVRITRADRRPARGFCDLLALCVCFFATSCHPHNPSLRVCNFSSQHIYVTDIKGLHCTETDQAYFRTGYAPEQSCAHSSLQNLQMTFPLVIQWKSAEDHYKKTKTAKLHTYTSFISDGNDIHWDLVLYENEWKALKQCYSAEPAYSTLMVTHEVLAIPLPKGCRQQSMLNLLDGHYRIQEAEENASR